MKSQIYDDAFFDYCAKNNYRSAKKIVPIILQVFSPKTLIDFGCGGGIGLKRFLMKIVRYVAKVSMVIGLRVNNL